ncbi:hypothetical protein EOL96_01695 [Candidatus Saccharibacteria bacterium]|nr:hypothetical protein [Candidatus Saccharibacteria bacterium]
MKKKFAYIFFAVLAVAAYTDSRVMNTILSMLLVGIVPGTTIVVPYWLMMSTYSALVSIIITICIERSIALYHARTRNDARRTRVPKRRYSHI